MEADASLLACAYLDDLTVVGSLAGLSAFVRCLRDLGPGVGLILNSAKCMVMASNHDVEASRVAAAALAVQPSPEGVLVLGAPVGTDSFVGRFLDGVVEESRATWERWTSLFGRAQLRGLGVSGLQVGLRLA